MITPGHKRALNRAMHELRRPLQALVLLEDGAARAAEARPGDSRRDLLQLATRALQDLDGALNGEASAPPVSRFSCHAAVLACLERWRPHAAGAGGIRVYWDAGPAMIEGDAARMAQALDNLVSNALEHGGRPVVVTGARVAERVRITIANGLRPSPAPRHPDPRRGHGTDVVSEVANAHGGRFALCHTASGCVAALELPLAEPGYARAA